MAEQQSYLHTRCHITQIYLLPSDRPLEVVSCSRIAVQRLLTDMYLKLHDLFKSDIKLRLTVSTLDPNIICQLRIRWHAWPLTLCLIGVLCQKCQASGWRGCLAASGENHGMHRLLQMALAPVAADVCIRSDVVVRALSAHLCSMQMPNLR